MKTNVDLPCLSAQVCKLDSSERSRAEAEIFRLHIYIVKGVDSSPLGETNSRLYPPSRWLDSFLLVESTMKTRSQLQKELERVSENGCTSPVKFVAKEIRIWYESQEIKTHTVTCRKCSISFAIAENRRAVVQFRCLLLFRFSYAYKSWVSERTV